MWIVNIRIATRIELSSMQKPCLSKLPLHRDVPDDVYMWLVEIDVTASLMEAAAGVLNAQELARASRYRHPADAARFATVRAALRHVLSLTLDADPAGLVLETDANGRPFLAMPHAPDINVSHSGAYGLIALSASRRVGVDIEETRSSLDWLELQSAVFADADRRALDALPELARSASFFACWSGKESVLKARGEGLVSAQFGLTSFSVLPCLEGRFAVSSAAGDIRAAALDAPAGYVAAVAWSSASIVS